MHRNRKPRCKVAQHRKLRPAIQHLILGVYLKPGDGTGVCQIGEMRGFEANASSGVKGFEHWSRDALQGIPRSCRDGVSGVWGGLCPWHVPLQGFQSTCARDRTLLQNGRQRRDFPFPRGAQSTRMISAVPSAEKRFISATRIWISAVCRSGSLAAMGAPKALRSNRWRSPARCPPTG